MPRLIAPLPQTDALVDRVGKIARFWVDWFVELITRVEASPRRITRVSLTTQAAAILATTLNSETLDAALYRVTYFLRVTQVPTSSGSVTLTIRFTADDGTVCAVAFSALNAAALSSLQSDSILVFVQRASAITYAVAYVSVGAVVLQFRLDLLLEEVPL